ncbi:U4/U6.U5 tri-snRNP-associated protein 1 [Archocentrus centrarchus]|uniref:U4/U6.U5 tri-snRNP-associated protein 1 n=1 Tax=Archocentrus centrarchus TaxID=63155 RepID=UPI0011E9B405|nr:U4/U6.U5 tri-snRNP-associated protein 1 [Archocentrus centrarchus]XP_030596081.1 U4/U6.U5 tri-snRNP-associated protein 1 [Archocentrus centrarchus]XP_030596091.1 U4/U6.U5 tri-snRNP-associated protein 1 [Archocentrus centrarchus]XP_030596098.1 U4/U6.U5 tri-snRNP-associated protein 1 [Archocentrus centrarchus]
MGSSKKHKEKSRDKDAEERRREHKKHRHKERDRDASDRDKEKRKRSRSRERSRRESRGKGERSSGEPRVKKEKVDVGYEESSIEVQPQSASGDASLSIEETNKLRAKLGLKPLEMNENKKELGTKEEPMVAETINPVLIQQQKEMREKLAAMKEKRILNQKLGKVKSLAEDDWLDDTAAWVERSRKLAKEKEMAEKRAKLLEEMDEEFGVSSLVEEEFAQIKQDAYTSRDLKGLKVQHKVESFTEGQTVILTLEDKGVLEVEEDVLVNVGLVDKEKAEKNVELKKKKPDYKPYEEEESVDDMVSFKPRSVLSKYDEEIEGEKKKSFRLNTGGFADGERERELQAMKEMLRNQAQSLEMPALTIASEYYTPQEMVSFKKTKRRVKKIRKKEKTLVADELVLDDTRSSDFGSRARGRGRKQEEEEDQEHQEEKVVTHNIPLLSDDIRTAEMDISDDEEFIPPEPVAIEEDEAEQELQKQLEKQRKLKQMQLLKDSGEKVAEQVKKLVKDDSDDADKKNNIVFNATSEFCRTLGDIPTYGLSGNREDQEDIMDFEQEEEKDDAGGSDSEMDENIGWSTVNLDEEQKQPDFSTASATILDEEPIVNSGLAAALLLCKNKGLLDTQVQKVARVKAPKGVLPNGDYCIEDKMGFDDKYSRREEYRGFTQDFKEKDGYKPDVKIEYVDESGRKLTPKEAFRQLSHRFHGKGSGKMKTERRMKKLEEEALLKKMSSSDTPLGTVALLQEKQKSQKTPYIVLSGSGKSMNANTITK